MKAAILLFIPCLSFLSNPPALDCAKAYSSADDAYSYCEKAHGADNWKASREYLRKAMDSFEAAIDHAEECECEVGRSSADDGYLYATKGYEATNWEQSKSYAMKARKSAVDTMSASNDCSDN